MAGYPTSFAIFFASKNGTQLPAHTLINEGMVVVSITGNFLVEAFLLLFSHCLEKEHLLI